MAGIETDERAADCRSRQCGPLHVHSDLSVCNVDAAKSWELMLDAHQPILLSAAEFAA
jgi:hypothetical protein